MSCCHRRSRRVTEGASVKFSIFGGSASKHNILNPYIIIELFMLKIHRQNRHIFRDKCMRMPPSLTISSSTRALALSPGYSSIAKTMNHSGDDIRVLKSCVHCTCSKFTMQSAFNFPRRGHYLWSFCLGRSPYTVPYDIFCTSSL